MPHSGKIHVQAPDTCHKCGKSINPDDKFCFHCGAPLLQTDPVKTSAPAEKLSFTSLLKWITIALITGIITGWIRYWIGYYILIQGVLVGLFLPWIVTRTAENQNEALAAVRFKIALLLFFSFMIAQAVGFGLAQPVFDPFRWVGRVWNGDTTESVFAIYSTGGVVHQTFSEGLSGGFWVLLWGIDLFFMFFFTLALLPLKTGKKRS